MLGKRILYAFLLLVPVAGLLTCDYALNGGMPGIWLFPLGCVIAALASQELHEMTRNWQPSARVVVGSTLLVSVISGAPLAWSIAGLPYPSDCPVGRLGWTAIGTALALAILFIDGMRRHARRVALEQQRADASGSSGPNVDASQPVSEPAAGASLSAPVPVAGQTVLEIASGLFVVVYIGVFYAFLVNLRLLGENPAGMTALVSMIVVVKMSDVGAYSFGRLFGRHKLAPRLSPGKTIEGAVGGLVTAAVFAVLYFAWIGPLFFPATRQMEAGPWWGWILYGCILAVAGVLGDLSESLVKRDVGRKDSSSWLPGLGGVLDVVDSLLLAAPAAYACWILGIVGPF